MSWPLYSRSLLSSGLPWAASAGTSQDPSDRIRAGPDSSTLAPSWVTRTCPPRADNCRPSSGSRPSRPIQYGASAQCAEPVTASSAIPVAGAKNRETKSASSSAAAVMISPRTGSRASASRSGRAPRTSACEPSTAIASRSLRSTSATGPPPSSPVTAATSAGSAGRGRRTGKRSRIQSPSAWASSRPARVSNRISPCAPSPAASSTRAAASVPCPHRSSSVVAVNQRSPNRPASPADQVTAVAGWLNSAPIRRPRPSPGGWSSTSTAAGFPVNGAVAKASTWNSRAVVTAPSSRPAGAVH